MAEQMNERCPECGGLLYLRGVHRGKHRQDVYTECSIRTHAPRYTAQAVTRRGGNGQGIDEHFEYGGTF